MNNKQVRVEMRLRNNALWHLVFDNFASVNEFSRAVGVDKVTVGRFLNLKGKLPSESGRGKTIPRICEYFHVLAEDIFPPALYQLGKTEAVVEVDLPALPITRSVLQIASPDDADSSTVRREAMAIVSASMDKLTVRQREVLAKRFGLNGEPECTLDEIAFDLGISRERVRAIEMHARRSLYHPLREKGFRDLFDRD